MNPQEQRQHHALGSRVADVETVTARLMHNGDALYLGGEALATRVNQLEGRLLMQDEEIAALKRAQGVTFNSLVEFCGRRLRKRLRWLVTGR